MNQAGALRIAPLPGETTWSLLGRVAARYGMSATDLRTSWEWRNSPPRSPGTSGVRPDAEVLLDPTGQDILVAMCRTDPSTMERALPTWTNGPALFTAPVTDGRPQGRWQCGAAAYGPVAYACRLCTARRTGQPVVAMRYREGWQRVCRRHRRWTLGAGDGHELEYLDLGGCPEIVGAQRRWPVVVRRATAAEVAPGAVFAVARAVVCQWWELALEWKDERIWPARLHRLAHGDAGPRFWWWRAVAREAAVFPEVMALAEALLDPAVAEMVWQDSGAESIRPFPPDGKFGRELGRRLDRPWLGAAGAIPDSSALNAWWGALVRQRRGTGQPGDWGQDPWWIKREDQPVSVAAQLRPLNQRAEGTLTWRLGPPTRTQLDQRPGPRGHRAPDHPRPPPHRAPGHRHPTADRHPQPSHHRLGRRNHRYRQLRPPGRHPPRPPRHLDPHPRPRPPAGHQRPPSRHRGPVRIPPRPSTSRPVTTWHSAVSGPQRH